MPYVISHNLSKTKILRLCDVSQRDDAREEKKGFMIIFTKNNSALPN